MVAAQIKLKIREDRGSGFMFVAAGDLISFKRNGAWVIVRVYKLGVSTYTDDNGELVHSSWLTARSRKTKTRQSGQEHFFDSAEVSKLRWLSRPDEYERAALDKDYAPLPTLTGPMDADEVSAAIEAAMDDAVGLLPRAQSGEIPIITRPPDDCGEGAFAEYYAAMTGVPSCQIELIDALAWHRLGWDVFSPGYEQARAEDE